MATATYYFDARSGSEFWEFSPDNMVDGSTASYSITDTANETELLTSNTATSTDLGTITKVELRVFGSKQFTEASTVSGKLRPVFSGTSDGDTHAFSWANGTGAWSSYFDITTDTNAPGTWSWTDVDNLDCDVVNDNNLPTNGHQVSKVEIQVTYTPSGTAYSMDCTVGEFALTGNNIFLIKALNASISVGTFALTGMDILTNRGWQMIVGTGQFILTGIDIITKFTTKQFTYQDKNTSTYTNQDKNTSTWTYQDEN